MASTHIQGLHNTGSASLAFGSNVTAGNLLIARIVWTVGSGVSISSITDTQGNTWTIHAATSAYNSTLLSHIQIASCAAKSSAANTVTVALSSGTPSSIRLDEYNNAAGSLVFDTGIAAQGGPAGPTFSSGSITTSTSNELGIVQFASDATLGPTYDTLSTGSTSTDAYTPYWYAEDAANLDLGSAGSVSVSTTLASGATTKNYAVNLAAFKVASAGGATATPSGVSAASAIGTPVAVGSATASPAGVSATSAIGTPVATDAVIVTPTGVQAASAIGTPTASGSATASPAGVQAASAIGTPTGAGAANALPSGVQATSSIGTPVATGGGASATASPAGVQATSSIGVPVAGGGANAYLAGVLAASAVGIPRPVAQPQVFGEPMISTSAPRNWTAASQARNWTSRSAPRNWTTSKD